MLTSGHAAQRNAVGGSISISLKKGFSDMGRRLVDTTLTVASAKSREITGDLPTLVTA